MGLERIGFLYFQRGSAAERSRNAVLILEGYDEVVHVNEHAGNGGTALRRHRDLHGAPRRLPPSSSSPSAAGEQHALLNVDRLVLAGQAGEIAGRGMARG